MRLLLVAALLLAAGTVHAANYDTLCATHVVENGDSLWSIANKYAVTQDELVAALADCLPGWNTGVALQVGEKICLPGYVPACDYVIDSGEVSTCKVYQIQQGDTLLLIASVFGVYGQDLIDLNSGVSSGVLQPGTFVRLPPWDYSVCPDPDSDAPSCRVYAVQSGDFVFGIASIFRVTVGALLEVNPGLAVDTYLQSGMRLRIPPFTASCGNGILASPPTTGIFSCRAYRVKTGNSLASIALLFKTTIASLVSVNSELADPSLLTPGKVIRIAPYPADCVSGILISFSGSTPVQAGPVSVIPPTTTMPSPSPASPSTSPSPASPSPAISPSPVVVTPSPSPSPTTTGPAPTTGVKLTLSLTGTSSAAVISHSAAISTAVAKLLSCPAAWVSVSATASRRRLQAVGDTTVVITVASASPAADAAKLQSAAASLTSLFASLGLAVTPSSLAVATYPTTASPSPASPSPVSPSPTPAAPGASTATSSSNTGAIVGGIVGGVGGAAVICGIVWLVLKKRREGAGAAPSAYAGGAGATATINTGLNVKTRTRQLAENTGYSSSPRGSTVTPRTRAGNMA